MAQYRVETEHIMKKYACILVDADSEAEAIEKARSASEDAFLERESAESCEWRVKRDSSWLGFISFFMGR